MSLKEVESAWEWLRKLGTQADKERFRPVYLEMQRLKKRVLELERAADKVMAPTLFDAKAEKERALQEGSKEVLEDLSKGFHGEPLSERLSKMRKGSEEWDRTLRWNNLTDSQAQVLIDKYRETNQDK